MRLCKYEEEFYFYNQHHVPGGLYVGSAFASADADSQGFDPYPADGSQCHADECADELGNIHAYPHLYIDTHTRTHGNPPIEWSVSRSRTSRNGTKNICSRGYFRS